MFAKKVRLHDLSDEEQVLTPTYGHRLLRKSLPRYELPEGEMSPETAYSVVHDELILDGNARLNLATFVTTWMEPEARLLMAETFDKNMIDKDEYPQTAEPELRSKRDLAVIWQTFS